MDTDGTIKTAKPVVPVVMGVSGCGKSTVAALLTGRLAWPFEEGDALHPQANIEKMTAGHPLTDEDRALWLQKVVSPVPRVPRRPPARFSPSFHDARVGQVIRFLDPVGGVLLPGVLRIRRAQRGVDAPGGQRRVGFECA